MPLDPVSIKTSSSTVNSNRNEKAYTKLKADTTILEELMVRKDCVACHQELNARLKLLEDKLDLAMTKLIATIKAELALIAIKSLASAPAAGIGAGGFTALATALATLGASITWSPRQEQFTVEPKIINKNQLKTKAKIKTKTDDAPLSVASTTTGGQTA